MLDKSKRFHLVGIGGAGMSGLAQLLIGQGVKVSGSDLKANLQTERINSLGAEVFIGHTEANVEGADVLIYSSAIDNHNPEIELAHKKEIPILKRAELLSFLMEDKIGIVIAGAHGKTTTTSMVSSVLNAAGLEPTVAIGGEVEDLGGNACLGSGDYFVAEADESDGSFLYLRPSYSIITNIDKEHMDFYKDMSFLEEAFSRFIDNTKGGGCCFYCHDDARLRKIMDRKKAFLRMGFGLKRNPFGIYPEALEISAGGSKFRVISKGEPLGRIELKVPGRHNVSNSLAAVGIGCELGVDFNTIKEALHKFRGVRRRFEIKGLIDDILIVDDYAHHPTELKATLSAAREYERRIVAVFQPHRYTRTMYLREEFAQAFGLADELILADIYPANEEPIDGVSSELLYRDLFKILNNVELIRNKEGIVRRLLNILMPGDLILTLGAGDIDKVAQGLKDALENGGVEKWRD